jgi:hypothetical protein
MMMNKAIRRGAIARGKRVRAASQARRERRWSMPICRDFRTMSLVYADGSPVDPKDPRLGLINTETLMGRRR